MHTIAIIDDHTLFSSGLKLLLDELQQPVSTHTFDSVTAFTHAPERDYSLVILDFYLPGHDFFETVSSIKARTPESSIVVVSASPSPNDKASALSVGAIAFIEKHCKPDDLLAIISAILDGSYVEHSALLKTSNPLEKLGLSERQLEILLLVAKGYSNKEIAKTLAISPETVKTHMRTIFQRIKVQNRIEAIDYMRQYGVL